MAELAFALDALRLVLAGAVIVLGLVFMLGGAIGQLRFPDFYTRLHASGAADTVGVVIVIVGLALAAPDWGMALKLALLAGLAAALGPITLQLLANAAHSGGLSPIAGPYVAPRPGVRRTEGAP